LAKIIEDYLKQFSNVNAFKKGGQKEIFLGEHNQNGRVIIKIGKYVNDSSLERINREVETLKSINSEYYPKNIDYIVDKINREFIVIEEFIENRNLQEVKIHYDNEQKLVLLLNQLILALKILWDKNIVHRDLKFDNILFRKNFMPVIIDLGIARLLDLPSLTNSMAFSGPCTPNYSSPEQLRNDKRKIDTRADFFAMGIILLELHLGYHPFEPKYLVNSKSIPENILAGIYVSPLIKNGTSMEFNQLILKLLAPEPFQRFRNYNFILDFIKNNF